jgi:hypothetical protein
MKNFRDITEAKETAVFTFGRFNPPTIGHEKLIKKVSQVAGSDPYYIYPSFTTNPKKDPLPHALKVAYMKKMFKKYAKNIIADKDSKTAINIAVKLYDKGFKKLVMVAGSDRVQEFDKLLNTYNGVEGKKHGFYKFDNISVVSAGERDPDAEGVEGMSASKMRAAASDGDYDSFSTGIPATLSDTDKKKLYRDVRKYMGIREERNMGDMSDFETLRDAYLVGEIWNVGDIVEANDIRGEVIRKGANYLSYVDEDNKVHKTWLHDIILEDITKRDLDQIEKYADKLFGAVGIDVEFTRHFMDRVNDARNKTPITTSELVRLFKQSYKKFGKKIARLGPDAEAVINDMKTNINMPFVLDLKGGELELIAKTVMRKKDFKTSGPKLAFEELSERNYRKEYDNYQGRPEQIARRSSRNKARRVMGDKTKMGMDVGHKDNNPLNNEPENLRNEDPSKNRREPRLREEPRIPRKKGQPAGSDKHSDLYTDENPKGTIQGLGFKDVDTAKASVNKIKNSGKKHAHKIQAAIAMEQRAKEMGKTAEAAVYRSYIEMMKKKTKEMEENLNELSSSINWVNSAIAKISQIIHPKGWDNIVKTYVDGMKDDEHRKHPSKWAVDVSKRYRDIDSRALIKYINTLVSKGKIPKELKAEYQMEKYTFSDLMKSIDEVKQDKEIKDKEGTQPAKYYAGDMAKSTKDKRDAHFKSKKSGPAPGDASAETKPSTHTKKFKQMYGEVKDHKTDYETFVKMYSPLNKSVDDASAKLKKITSKNRGAMGLTDPKVKASPEFKKAKAEYEKSVDLTKKFLKGVPKDFLKKNAQSRRLRREEVELDEKRAKKAVAGGKVQKLVTAHGYSFKGKNYKEIDMELVKIDNSSQMVTFNIIHPAEIFGNEMKIPFKNLRRGRYMATDTSKINNEVLGKDADMGDYIDDFAKSDSPQFKGKSKEKRKEMAIAAYLSKNESLLDNANKMLSESGHTDVASMKNKVQIAMSALQKMQGELSKLGDEDDLPTWWTNKVATAVSRLDDMSDYLDTQVEEFELNEKIEGLVTKAEKSGMPYGILKKVYDRGMAAYKTGHRPGTTAQQWAFARVNSFVTKSSGTWGKADKDLAKQVRGESTATESLWDNIRKKKDRIAKGSGEKMRKKGDKGAPTPDQIKRANEEACCDDCDDLYDHVIAEAEYQGKKVKLNDPIRTSENPNKKFKVYTMGPSGKVVVVRFGDPKMGINRDDPKARAAFRSRHSCDEKKDKTTAGYWSCFQWRASSKVDN